MQSSRLWGIFFPDFLAASEKRQLGLRSKQGLGEGLGEGHKFQMSPLQNYQRVFSRLRLDTNQPCGARRCPASLLEAPSPRDQGAALPPASPGSSGKVSKGHPWDQGTRDPEERPHGAPSSCSPLPPGAGHGWEQEPVPVCVKSQESAGHELSPRRGHDLPLTWVLLLCQAAGPRPQSTEKKKLWLTPVIRWARSTESRISW